MHRILSCVAVVGLTVSLLGSIKAAEPEPKKSAEPDTAITVAEKNFDPPMVLGKKPVSVTLEIPKDKQEEIAKIVKAGKIPDWKFDLVLEGLTMKGPDSYIVAFLNVPQKMLKGDEWKKLNDETAYCCSEASFSLYGLSERAEPVNLPYVFFPLAFQVLEYLGESDQWHPEKLTVTLIRDWGRDPRGEKIIPDKVGDMSIKAIKFQMYEGNSNPHVAH
jgi:hypothetical protein